MLSHDAFRGVHLGGEVLVVGGKLNPFGSFEEVEAVAFFDMEPVQDFFGQYDANGVANCCDLDSRRHTSLPGFYYNLCYNSRWQAGSLGGLGIRRHTSRRIIEDSYIGGFTGAANRLSAQLSSILPLWGCRHVSRYQVGDNDEC